MSPVRRWQRRTKTRPDPFPCAGECFERMRDAEERIAIARLSRPLDYVVGPAYAYQCLDGHWHAHLEFA